jgi:hypothetical protein
MSQYVSEILWQQKDFLALLALRIQASLKQAGIPIPAAPPYAPREDVKERLLEMAFVAKMQWGDSRRNVSEMMPTLLPERMVDTYKIVYTLSYERPRWAI